MRHTIRRVLLVAQLSLLLIAGGGAAEDDYTVSGTIDTYYAYNFNRPAPGTIDPIRVYDPVAGAIRVPLIQVAIEKPVGDHDFGFAVKLQNGLPIDLNTATITHGGVTNNNPEDAFHWLQEAYVRYHTADEKEAYLDWGKFNTHIGYEVIEAKDNLNYSRSILFGWAIPFYHVGLRYTHPWNDEFSTTAIVAHGWNNLFDNNAAKSFGLQAAWADDEWGAVANWMGGNEGTGFRNVFNGYVTYSEDGWDLVANGSYGMDPNNGANAQWYGVAGYARYNWDNDSLGVRGEVFFDPQGFMLGTGLNERLWEITGTYEHRFGQSLTARAEWRTDVSNRANFFAPRRNMQHTLTLGAIAYWD